MPSSTRNKVTALEARLGHRFHDPALLSRALTHASRSEPSNERLEFLGDRVLGLVIAERLHDEFPHESEGGLAVRYNVLVRRQACAEIAKAAELGDHLVMTAAESSSGGRNKAAILSGALEAVIAALYLDGGMKVAQSFILRYWEESFATFAADLRDAKTVLQEWAQSGVLEKKTKPSYEVKKRTGPDHAPVFTVEAKIPGQVAQKGIGPTKRDAEQDAAQAMLKHLGVWPQ